MERVREMERVRVREGTERRRRQRVNRCTR